MSQVTLLPCFVTKYVRAWIFSQTTTCTLLMQDVIFSNNFFVTVLLNRQFYWHSLERRTVDRRYKFQTLVFPPNTENNLHALYEWDFHFVFLFLFQCQGPRTTIGIVFINSLMAEFSQRYGSARFSHRSRLTVRSCYHCAVAVRTIPLPGCTVVRSAKPLAIFRNGQTSLLCTSKLRTRHSETGRREKEGVRITFSLPREQSREPKLLCLKPIVFATTAAPHVPRRVMLACDLFVVDR